MVRQIHSGLAATLTALLVVLCMGCAGQPAPVDLIELERQQEETMRFNREQERLYQQKLKTAEPARSKK